jgi:hypothetical protein
MSIQQEIQNEIDNIKSKLSIAHDLGDTYQYITLTQLRDPYVWSEQQINEILRGLIDIDAHIIHMTTSHNGYRTAYGFLFKLIYN